MARKAGETLPPNLKNKTVAPVKSSVSMIEEMAKQEDKQQEKNNIDVEKKVEEQQEKNIDKEEKNIKVSKQLDKILKKNKVKKIEKKKTMIYLEEELMNQIKTISQNSKISLTKIIEMTLKEAFAGQEVDLELVEKYNDINIKKGNRNK